MLDIETGVAASAPKFLTVFSPRPSLPEQIFFLVSSHAGDGYGPGGTEMWRSDGTADGTQRAFAFTAAEVDVDPINNARHPPRLVEFKETLFFSANRGRAASQQPKGYLDGRPESEGRFSAADTSGEVPQSIAVRDIDVGDYDLSLLEGLDVATAGKLRVNLTCNKCHLSLPHATTAALPDVTWVAGGPSAPGGAAAAVVFLATPRDANYAMREVMYQTKPLETGEDRVLVTVDDLGGSGYTGQARVSAATVDLWIESVNTGPELVGPATATTTLNFRADLILPPLVASDFDLRDTAVWDAHGRKHEGAVLVTMSIPQGRLTLPTTVGLHFTLGEGVADTEMRWTSSLEDANTALSGVHYRCLSTDGCLEGTHPLTVSVTDGAPGHTGEGFGITATHVTDIVVGADVDAETEEEDEEP